LTEKLSFALSFFHLFAACLQHCTEKIAVCLPGYSCSTLFRRKTDVAPPGFHQALNGWLPGGRMTNAAMYGG